MLENLSNYNFVNAYFGICIIVWVLNVIATLAIIVIKPLRKWFMGICYRWGKTYGEEVFDVIEDDINEIISSLDEILAKKENNEFEENEDEDL